MRKSVNGRLPAAIAVTGVAFWMAASAEARQVITWEGVECTVTSNMERIPVQADPVAVQLRHSEAVGDSATVSFPEESGIGVVSVGREAEDEENTLRAALNTSEAAAGEWAITLRGTAGECTGTVVVGAAEPDGL
jgi:hypothetical protein